jgi:hypothetical protein
MKNAELTMNTIVTMGFFPDMMIEARMIGLHTKFMLVKKIAELPPKNMLQHLFGTQHDLTLMYNDVLNKAIKGTSND